LNVDRLESKVLWDSGLVVWDFEVICRFCQNFEVMFEFFQNFEVMFEFCPYFEVMFEF